MVLCFSYPFIYVHSTYFSGLGFQLDAMNLESVMRDGISVTQVSDDMPVSTDSSMISSMSWEAFILISKQVHKNA